MKKALLKDTFFEIKNNFKRFLSILLIVLLGVGFFAGIKATSPDMQITLDKYFDDQNAFDIQLVSTLGLTNKDVLAIKELEETKVVYGAYSKDAIIDINNTESVVKIHSITDNINNLILLDGRFPENDNECLVEEYFFTFTNTKIGDNITITLDTKEDEDPFLKETDLTIVGVVLSPLYISQGRGSTKLLSGRIDYYMYVPESLIDSDIYTEIYITLKNAKEISSFSTQYEEIVETTKNKIKELGKTRKEIRYADVLKEANKKLSDGQNKLNEEREKYDKEISDAERKIRDAKKKIFDGEIELNDGTNTANIEFSDAERKLHEADSELKQNEDAFYAAKTSAMQQIEQSKIILASLEQNLATLVSTINQLHVDRNNLQSYIDALQDSLLSADPGDIPAIQAEIDVENINLTNLDQYIYSLNQDRTDLEGQISFINSGIVSGLASLQSNEDLLIAGRVELQNQKALFESKKHETYTTLEDAKKELQKGKAELLNHEQELEDAKIEAEEKFAEAQEEIDDANKKIREIKRPDWYILDRDMNEGYASFAKDSERIANVGKVFPLVFFVIAAFISLNSMTRIVEEQRVQIGTLKALGYTKIQIAMKYIIYATLATIIGGVTGMLIGFDFLPKTIFAMYTLMYTLPPVIAEFNVEYALTSMIIAGICTIGATIISCINELSNTPANLMRPKSPKLGKRVLLENITFIWSRLNFIKKVTIRNMFRYKKKFLMTIIGVAGCTSLIIAGFGLKDSIATMVPYQYGKLFKYTLHTTFKDPVSISEANELSEKHNLYSLLTSSESGKITGSTQDLLLIVPGNLENMPDFIELKNRLNSNQYFLNDTSIIITEKIAKLLNLKVGDTIEIENSDEEKATVVIGNITENYMFHYIYLTPVLYKELFNREPEYNSLYSITDNLDDSEEKTLVRNILLNDNVSSATTTSYSEDFFQETLDSLTFIVWVLIVAAGLLAFIVLYNLSNLNISERVREIATIKVLGFYDKEVYQYISRESILLTLIGILFGLAAGYFLNLFIINTCELDNVMFTRIVKIQSFVYASLITLLFSYVIGIVTHFSLRKVDMIESLKSVE